MIFWTAPKQRCLSGIFENDFYPCHRVIGASGKLTGYGGGLKIKAYLLGLEKQQGIL